MNNLSSKKVIFWVLGFALAALAGLVDNKSAWNTPLLILAVILVGAGTFFEFKPTKRETGYRLYSKYLSVKDVCEEVIYIRRGNTNVAVQIDPDGKMYVGDNARYISTDGKTANTLDTVSGKLTVTRLKGGYRVNWTEGTWAYQ